MNKIFISTIIFLSLSVPVSAQKTQDQINKAYAEQYRKINMNPRLSGPEKARLKKELALKQDQENRVFDEAYKKKYGSSKDQRKRMVEDKMGLLEKKYEQDKKRIENNPVLGKDQKKAHKEALKKKYESQKALLKKEKNNI
ncbi:hypothetical protein [Chryseobacterium vrystaatense]|uniref:DUF4890 domain-containing protein n=1 Tax=Chryseobacterium vrystaatense TaxID=307480 RepID=A0ABR4UFY5_9FLAO|nr:hypothetical protein [Chryseobacterium vrystaatense]KFF23323.1 hypothetical protein IW16_23860 [Chryseobacterium vrystaatense]